MIQAEESPLVRIAELDIDPQQLDAYKLFLKEEIEASLERETGVLMLSAVSLNNCAERIRIFEIYASRAAYESHLQSPHFLRYKNATANMVRSLSLHDANPICLRTKAAIHI